MTSMPTGCANRRFIAGRFGTELTVVSFVRVHAELSDGESDEAHSDGYQYVLGHSEHELERLIAQARLIVGDGVGRGPGRRYSRL